MSTGASCNMRKVNRWKQKLTEEMKTVVTLLPYICPVHINVYIYIHTNTDIYKTSEQTLKSTGL